MEYCSWRRSRYSVRRRSSLSARTSSSDGEMLMASVSRNVARLITSSTGIRKLAAVAPDTAVTPDTARTATDGIAPPCTRSAAMPV